MKGGYCIHTDSERLLHGTWTTLELDLSIEKGYVVQKYWETWHWGPDQRSSDLFHNMIKVESRPLRERESGTL